ADDGRTLLTVAHRGDLVGRGALEQQGLAHRLGTLLAQADVVLTAAPLVGVAFQADAGARIAGEVAAVGRHHRVVVGLHVEAVVVEVDHPVLLGSTRAAEGAALAVEGAAGTHAPVTDTRGAAAA